MPPSISVRLGRDATLRTRTSRLRESSYAQVVSVPRVPFQQIPSFFASGYFNQVFHCPQVLGRLILPAQ